MSQTVARVIERESSTCDGGLGTMVPSLSIAVLLMAVLTSAQNNIKKYRSDYEYNVQTKAFYKLHIESAPASRATSQCRMEGASLMVVASKLDLIQAHTMFKSFPDIGDQLLIGSEAMPSQEPEETTMNIELFKGDSLEEKRSLWPSARVMNRQGELVSSRNIGQMPFICKVDLTDAYYDTHCKVYSRDYTYIPDIGSCYKIPRAAYNWNAAFAECGAEGAHLVVINSEAEHQAVKHMVITAPAVDHATKHYFFHAGFRANRPTDGTDRVFKTIFNQTLEEAGYGEWSEGEPNNANNNEYCGCIFRNNGNFNDIDCVDTLAFICEHEIGSHSSS